MYKKQIGFVALSVLLFCPSLWACIENAKRNFNLEGTSYQHLNFELDHSDTRGLVFRHNSSELYYNSARQAWCVGHVGKANSEDACLEADQRVAIIDDNTNKHAGILEASGKDIYFYSITSDGQKDQSKPYIKLTDKAVRRGVCNRMYPPGCGESTYMGLLTATAFDAKHERIGQLDYHQSSEVEGKVDGYSGYNPTFNVHLNPTVRSLGLMSENTDSKLELSGNKIVTRPSCDSQNSDSVDPFYASYGKPEYSFGQTFREYTID